jgi:type IV pilus assembly protein PilX
MKPLKHIAHRRRQQSGVTLVIAMIFLICFAMLGVWAASSNALQERMAGNTRNRDLALQAAESALKDAEATIDTWRTRAFDGTDGLLAYVATQANDRVAWQAASRWTTHRTLTVGTPGQLASAPRYVIEKMPNTANPSDTTQFDVENYRVTAMAVGGDSQAVVILQSIIRYTP